jgi:hypothetical protein
MVISLSKAYQKFSAGSFSKSHLYLIQIGGGWCQCWNEYEFSQTVSFSINKVTFDTAFWRWSCFQFINWSRSDPKAVFIWAPFSLMTWEPQWNNIDATCKTSLSGNRSMIRSWASTPLYKGRKIVLLMLFLWKEGCLQDHRFCSTDKII